MADGRIENVVRIHLTLLRAVGAGAAAQVSNHVAGPEQRVPEGETSIVRGAGLVGVNPSLSNLEKLLVYSKSKDEIPGVSPLILMLQ